MTFDQAVEIMKEVYPKTYFSVKFSITVSSAGTTNTEISLYVSGQHWTNDWPTFEEAFRELTGESKSSTAEGITDEPAS